MPREGHDDALEVTALVVAIFLSTCPVRGTTGVQVSMSLAADISIHVPREGHDLAAWSLTAARRSFLSTCPVRGTTRGADEEDKKIIFLSTCPVRGTTDKEGERAMKIKDFYPRAP